MFKTFQGGVHPPHLKQLTSKEGIKKAKAPKQVVMPLNQHIGATCEPVVSVGDEVKRGTLIGKSDKFISCYVHSSISGEVIKIEPRPHPVLGFCNSIVIDSDGKDEPDLPVLQINQDTLTQDEIINNVREAGIAGLGGACFPTHVKLSPPKGKHIDKFILNGAECEPYLSCDHRLMIEEPQGLIKGVLLIMKAIGVNKGIIAIEDNKPDAIKAMRAAVSELRAPLKVVSLHTKYPQGAEKQIIKVALNRVVPAGGLPMDVGCLVQNVGTAFAVYEAIYFKKPLIERVVTITGPCVEKPANLRVRIGTLLGDLVDSFGGFVKEPKRIIFGGPMMGISQYTINVPIIKGTSGVIFFSEENIDVSAESVCIRCAKCLKACPVKLAPTTLMNYVKKEMFKEAKERGIEHCYECGCCAYECPAKIPLLDYMKYGKSRVM
jgi:Na+-translocating ferredoxin:NAD+ oxidoreductase subunit C